MLRSLPAAAVASLLLLVVSWGAAAGLVSAPLEPLLDAPIEMHDVGATSARLRVTTAVDLACVVVFGTDRRFGGLALDLDMGGAAHRDHHVLLVGLEPDTEYVYRMQGSAPDGSFYASEVYTFRTLPAAVDERAWRNVATLDAGARVVEASSAFGAAFAPEHALDGAADTAWSSRGDGDDAFLTIELPEPVEFVGFGAWSRTMGTSAEIFSYEVVTETGAVFGPFELDAATRRFDVEASGVAQRFTFRVVSSSGGNTGLVEFAVFVADDR